QLGAFVWAETGVVALVGLFAGTIIGWTLSKVLVTVLNGVFDPAPSSLAVPWTYLFVLLGVSVVATASAALAALVSARRPRIYLLRTA
ncbi:MAG: FtsX-like permease family protein, partial [Aquihabitans sp.]